jgi:hypothetical protein
VLATPDEHRINLFNAMKKAESEQYAAYTKADKARKEWETACTNKAMTENPNLHGLVSKIIRLTDELNAAKDQLTKESSSANLYDMFRKWSR